MKSRHIGNYICIINTMELDKYKYRIYYVVYIYESLIYYYLIHVLYVSGNKYITALYMYYRYMKYTFIYGTNPV